MDSKESQEGGDSSDSDFLENWTIVDTEEALEATTLIPPQNEEEQEFEDTESTPGHLGIEKTESLKNQSAELSDSQNKKEEEFTEPEGDLISDTDDGVSIITDSEPEELQSPVAPALMLTAPKCHTFSEHSNDYFDSSDMSGLHELPLDLGQRGSRKYVHQRNHRMNVLLNTLVLLFIATGLGLGIGHFLGLHEECSASQPNIGYTSDSLVLDHKMLLQKLESENEFLKLQLRQLQEDIDKQVTQDSFTDSSNIKDATERWVEISEITLPPLWNVNGAVADPDHRTEAANVYGEASLALADNLSKTSAVSQIDNSAEVIVEVESEEQLEAEAESNMPDIAHNDTPNKKHDFTQDIKYPYDDKDLEVIQTRYVELNAARANDKKKQDILRKNEKRETPKTKPDSFFNKMEIELNTILSQVVDYSSNLVKNNNLKDHVATSIGVLSNTLQDMQGKVRSLSDMTAQHSIHAIDKVKKSVFKMVQNVKHTSDNLMKRNPTSASMSHNFMKGVYHLKDGLVDKWCHLKGKMARSLGAKEEEITNKCRLQYYKHEDEKTALNKNSFKHTKRNKNPDYVLKKQFKLKIKNHKNSSLVEDDKYGKHFENQKYKIKSKSEKVRYDKQKKFHKDSHFTRQKHGEHDQKQHACLQEGNCSMPDGEWMDRLAKGRAKQRHHEHESDWVFNRAKGRQESRQHEHEEEGNWYLKRGKSRNQDRGDYVVHQGYSSPWVDTRKL